MSNRKGYTGNRGSQAARLATETSSPERIAIVLRDPAHITLIAVLDGQALGFVDGFLTFAANGTSRWEIDLLAVHPRSQGQGMATRLVEASTDAGRKASARLARGLVGVENIPSQRTFARCGYTLEPELQALYISSTSAKAPVPEAAHLIPVSTLNYVGAWVEGTLSPESFAAGQAIHAQNNWDVVGAVIPLSEPASIWAAQAAGYTLVGYYRWWQLDLHES